MGTTDRTVGAGVIPHIGTTKPYVIENQVSIVGLATAEVVQSLAIKAGTYVMNVAVKIVTAEASGVATATVGDGAGANSWDAQTDLAAAAGTWTVGAGGTDAYVTAGKLYTAADTIDLTLTLAAGPATSGVYIIKALCFDLS